MPKTPMYVTVSELNKHKKEVTKMINEAVKGLKKWDKKQDKSLLKKEKK